MKICNCIYEGNYENDGPWICNLVSDNKKDFLPRGYYPGIDCRKGMSVKRDKRVAAWCKYFVEAGQLSLFN